MTDTAPSPEAPRSDPVLATGQSDGWNRQRGRLQDYFDRTAVRAWETLTTDAPVSGVRAKVRQGREATRATLMGWLPADMTGMRLLDAGCGTGALACEAAVRGAEVLGIDISPTLIGIARTRLPAELADGVRFVAGDMLAIDAAARLAGLAPRAGDGVDAHGRTRFRFDAIVAMDSLIHYEADDMVAAAATLADALAPRDGRLLFTFAPQSPLLFVAKAAGKLFPRSDRSPAIAPVGADRLRRLLEAEPRLSRMALGRSERISRPFYISQPLELTTRDGARERTA